MNKQLQDFYNVPNPAYYKALRRNVYTGHMKQEIFLGANKQGILPPGAAYFHKKFTGKLMPGLPVFDKMCAECILYPFELRPEQKPIFLSCLNKRCGLVDFKTSGGKTVLMTMLTHVWNKKTLIVVRSKGDVKYFVDTFKGFLRKSVGVYYSDGKDLQNITITTFASFSQKTKMFKDFGFDILLIDEADVFFSDNYRKSIITLNAERVFGFTGTIETEPDEFLRKADVPCLVRFYGAHIVGVSDKEKDPLKNVFYRERETEYFDEDSISVAPKEWVLYRKFLDDDDQRKADQIDYILKNHDHKKDFTLVLFDRVSDVERFARTFKKELNLDRIYRMHGNVKKQERDDLVDKFCNYGGILFAQHKTSGRGSNYPKCNKLFILFPNKNASSLRQMVGRVGRFIKGKESFVYDWVDSSLKFQWKKRKKTYREFFNINPKEL